MSTSLVRPGMAQASQYFYAEGESTPSAPSMQHAPSSAVITDAGQSGAGVAVPPKPALGPDGRIVLILEAMPEAARAGARNAVYHHFFRELANTYSMQCSAKQRYQAQYAILFKYRLENDPAMMAHLNTPGLEAPAAGSRGGVASRARESTPLLAAGQVSSSRLGVTCARMSPPGSV